MQCGQGRAALWVVVLLLWAAPSPGVERGQSLADALEELRRAGLQLVFSSALVDPGLSVSVDPGSGSPAEIARRILAPHGLTLAPVRSDLFAVVRQTRRDSVADASDTAQAAAARAAGPLHEVDVYASRYAIEQHRPAALAELTRDDLAVMPGLNQDVLRVTRYLPGTASNALSARTHVRGGRDDELAVFFDGVPLFEPFHYKDIHALLGILDPQTISRIEFFSGVFPARYGNRLSGVLDITPRAWTGASYHELGASLLYSHVLSQGRLASSPVEWLAAVRHSNVELVTNAIESEELEPDFLDALARIELEAGERSKIALGWLLLDDGLEVALEDGTERARLEYRDATGWGSWRFRPNDEIELRTVVSRTERHTDRTGSVLRSESVLGTADDRRRFDTVTARVEASARLSDHWSLYGGMEWYRFDSQYAYDAAARFDPVFASALGRPPGIDRQTRLNVRGEAYAGYGAAFVSLSPRIDVEIGLRWDAQRYGAAFRDEQVSPRMALQYRHDPATVMRLSWGRLAQTQRPDELQVQDGDTRFYDAQRASQTVISLERELGHLARLRIEAFDKRIATPRPVYENLLDPFTLLPELEVDRARIAPSRSRAYGAELSLRWDTERSWSGWTSYSWSEATDHLGDLTAPRTWNQRHALASGLSWTQDPWRLSGNVTWHSGWRRNELRLVQDSTSSMLELSPRNSSSWPSYLSLDLRAAWRRPLRKGMLEVFAEVGNLTDHENLCCTEYQLVDSPSDRRLRADTSSWLPRLGLVGVKWELPR